MWPYFPSKIISWAIRISYASNTAPKKETVSLCERHTVFSSALTRTSSAMFQLQSKAPCTPAHLQADGAFYVAHPHNEALPNGRAVCTNQSPVRRNQSGVLITRWLEADRISRFEPTISNMPNGLGSPIKNKCREIMRNEHANQRYGGTRPSEYMSAMEWTMLNVGLSWMINPLKRSSLAIGGDSFVELTICTRNICTIYICTVSETTQRLIVHSLYICRKRLFPYQTFGCNDWVCIWG